MRQLSSARLAAPVLLACLWVLFAAPAAATSVDIILQGDSEPSAAASGVAVTLYNLDTGRGYPGRTQDDGLAHFPDVTPGRYRIVIEGRGLAHLEYRTIKGAAFAHSYKLGEMTNVPTVAGLAGSLDFILEDADEAYEIGDRDWFEDSRQQVTDLRNLHANALAQLDAIDPKGTQTAMRAQHHAVILRCDDALKSFQTAVWPGVHLNLQLDPPLGTWAISPIPIKNTEDCGQVYQTGSMTVSQKVGPGHWRGTYTFRWDTSNADPACKFKFSRSGTVKVDLFLSGTTVTVKYSNTGQNTFVDDILTLDGNVMTGWDASGQGVTYTRS